MSQVSVRHSHLFARLHDARAETDTLFDIVKPEFLFSRPISERHRLAFYIGHLEAFDWNLLAPHFALSSDREALDKLFAFGIDPVEGNLPSDEPSDWPPLPTFYRYREQVRAELDRALQNVDGDPADLDNLLHVALEHRQMHAETLSYLLQQLPFEAKRAASERAPPASHDVVAETLRITAGTTTLGMRAAPGEFGWDNEFDAHDVAVPAFEIDKYKVTNGQYLDFVRDGGYTRREWWSDVDWQWLTHNAVRHPAFWLFRDGDWYWRSMFEPIPLPRAWPAYVSHAEASAYARWAGRALPSEAQWQRAAFGDAHVESIDQSQNEACRFDPCAVDAAELIPPGPFGVLGMRGNGWEWTSTVFAPFPGFRTFPTYPGYSAPFFDGKHFVLKGGSPRTAASMLRPSFRNWFQPHYPYVYAGFRCIDR